MYHPLRNVEHSVIISYLEYTSGFRQSQIIHMLSRWEPVRFTAMTPTRAGRKRPTRVASFNFRILQDQFA